ncbi:hypothetical protein [Pediococcus pentosaceus]|nr:hypothetical protein [Pediococcus pentosaceus]
MDEINPIQKLMNFQNMKSLKGVRSADYKTNTDSLMIMVQA